MKHCLTILLFVLLPFFVVAQPAHALEEQNFPDSLKQILRTASNDSMRFEAGRLLYSYYEEVNRDSAAYYANEKIVIAKRNNRKIEEAFCLAQKGYQLAYLGRFGEALTCLLQAHQIADDPANDEKDTWTLTVYSSPGKSRLLTLSLTNHMFGHLMLQTENIDRQLFYLKKGRRIALEINNKFRIMVAGMVLGSSYLAIDKPDSALIFTKESEQAAIDGGIMRYYGYIWFVMGDLYLKKGDKTLALDYYYKSLQSGVQQNNLNSVAVSQARLINYYLQEGNKDSVLFYALKNLQLIKWMGNVTSAAAQDINIGTAYEQLYNGYKLNNEADSAFKYQGLALRAKDSLSEIRFKNLADFQNLLLNEQLRLQSAEKEKLQTENRIRIYLLVSGIVIALLISFFIYRDNRQKQKAYKLLQEQKEKTDIQKDKADKALHELKSTQSQLIQQEKMASLGEVTAGIAHEIQNPLNFVNNFSEVNGELISELVEEVDRGNAEEAKLIAGDIKQNLEKINHHGKRADAIVKSMLQHSGSSTGQKEHTDINDLADEYLRLAYHGMRAKDKSFNTEIKTDFDGSIGEINIVPHDIGRVLLNLFNNAFYAVNEKTKLPGISRQLSAESSELKADYKPFVSVQTRKLNEKIEIIVLDNGPGIPQNIIDKIFQPFFTTKPTGQGTGLGLSLAYDIVKTHGGEIKVETKEGEGSEFVIQLPV